MVDGWRPARPAADRLPGADGRRNPHLRVVRLTGEPAVATIGSQSLTEEWKRYAIDLSPADPGSLVGAYCRAASGDCMATVATMNSRFTHSDAWVLLSVCYAAPRGRWASPRDIIAAGDAIGHAVFTNEELRRGLAKLIAASHVEVRDQRYSVTGATRGEFDRAYPNAPTPKRRGSAISPAPGVNWPVTAMRRGRMAHVASL